MRWLLRFLTAVFLLIAAASLGVVITATVFLFTLEVATSDGRLSLPEVFLCRGLLVFLVSAAMAGITALGLIE